MGRPHYFCYYPKVAHLTAGTAIDEAQRFNASHASTLGQWYVFECPCIGRTHYHIGRRPNNPATPAQLNRLKARFA